MRIASSMIGSGAPPLQGGPVARATLRGFIAVAIADLAYDQEGLLVESDKGVGFDIFSSKILK